MTPDGGNWWDGLPLATKAPVPAPTNSSSPVASGQPPSQPVADNWWDSLPLASMKSRPQTAATAAPTSSGQGSSDVPAYTEFGPLPAYQGPTPTQSQVGADLNAPLRGAVRSVGGIISGVGELAQAGTGPSAQRVLSALDMLDQGKTRDAYQGLTDTERQQVSAYKGADPSNQQDQRAALQQTIDDYGKPNAITRAGESVQQFGNEAFPVAPEKEGFQTNVLGMAGGVLPAALASAVAGPLGAAAAIGSQAYDSTYKDAIAKGATPEIAENAAGKSAVMQTLTMALPVGRLLMIPAPVRDGLAKTLVNLGQNGVEFGSANAVSTFANNYVAQQTYDPTRSLTQGVGEAGLEGAVTGLVVPALGVAVRSGQQATPADIMKAPNVDSAINAAQSFISQDATKDIGTSWAGLFASKSTENANYPLSNAPTSQVSTPAETAAIPETTPAAPESPGANTNTVSAAKQIASAYYKISDEVGGTVSPRLTNEFIDEAEKLAPQTEEGQLVAGKTPITELVERLQNLRDKPISLQGAQEIDESLGNLIDGQFQSGRLSKEGYNLRNLQLTFRNMIMNAGPEDTVGGVQGFEALQQGRVAWAQAMKMMDLERIQTRADLTDNTATLIKSDIRRLLSNPSAIRGYSPEEIDALKDAANRGVIGGALHVFGSRMIPWAAGLVGSGGGPVSAAAHAGVAYAGTAAARAGASYLQSRRLQNAMNVLGQGVPPPPAPLP